MIKHQIINITKAFFATFILLFTFPVVSHAATITVSPGQSIQAAVNSASAGDTIQIHAGTYNESVTVSKSGSAGSPTKVMGFPGERPVIDGQNSRSEGLSIRGSYITVSNIKITNHTGHDVDIDGASNVVVDNLEVYVTGRALHIQNSNNVTVRNSTITTPTNTPRQTDGIYSQRNKNNIYENNHIIIYNNDTTGHDDAIQMYLDDSMIVRNNYLAQVNSKTSNAQCLYATTMAGTSYFYNNVVNMGNAQSNGLSFRRLPTLGGTGTVEIVGNTVYGQRLGHGIWVTETDNPVVKNNLVYTPSGATLTLSGSTAGVSNNIGTNTDPKFVNIAGQDFHLQSSSPAINAGASLGAPYNVDKDGNARPLGGGWDIGAYEYGGSGPVITPPPTSPPSQTPTPTPGTKTGDVNADGKVDIVDIGVVIDNYGKSPIPNSKADVNRDGKVDIIDIGIVIDNYGK